MNSTIHDLYFSETNFNYIYELISKLIYNETGTDISKNNTYINIYKSKYPKIFNDYDADDISILNRKLIDNIGNIILSSILSSVPIHDKISYNIIKYKSVLIDSIEHICIKLNNNKIEVNDSLNFYEHDKFLNTLICTKTIDNYIFVLAKGFNSKSTKIII